MLLVIKEVMHSLCEVYNVAILASSNPVSIVDQ